MVIELSGLKVSSGVPSSKSTTLESFQNIIISKRTSELVMIEFYTQN